MALAAFRHDDDPGEPRPIKKWRVPALEQRYPPGCPDADWCAGNNVCYWDCCRQDPRDDEDFE